LEAQVPFSNQKPWQSLVMWEAKTSQVTKRRLLVLRSKIQQPTKASGANWIILILSMSKINELNNINPIHREQWNK
jgi:hypothetical protein